MTGYTLIERPKAFEELLREADDWLRAGTPQEALAVLEKASTMELSAIERYTIGEALLRASNSRHGWDLYDLHPSRPADRLPGIRRWDGQPCRVLVVVAEQGFGDAIQFMRFLPEVAERAGELVFAVHDELLDVVSSSPLVRDFTVISKSTARNVAWTPEARWERLMSLPTKILHPRIEATEPYLKTMTVTWKRRLAAADSVTVGVVWRSTPRRGFPNRSFPVRLVQLLTESGKVRLIALHRTRDIKALPKGVELVPISNFKETAEVISQCDYVVTADTVTAHLAPALGVPTLVCLRHRADWRWGTPLNPTRWYAAVELLFQDSSEDWAPVLSAAARHIADSTGPPSSRLAISSPNLMSRTDHVGRRSNSGGAPRPVAAEVP